jgi:hypothetical protein
LFVKIFFGKLKVEELDSSFKINSKVSDLSAFIVFIVVLPEKDLWISITFNFVINGYNMNRFTCCNSDNPAEISSNEQFY